MVLLVLRRGISHYIPSFRRVWNMVTIYARRTESYYKASTGMIDSFTQTRGSRSQEHTGYSDGKIVSEDNPSLDIGKMGLGRL